MSNENSNDESMLSVLAEHFTDEELCEMLGDDEEEYFFMENW